MIAIGIRQLQHRNFSVAEPLKSAARFSKSRGHFCDVLASECPCRAAGDFQPAPIRRLEALCITEIQNLLSNSKVRNVIHSGRITFRVLTNYIPRFGELQSAVVANYNPRSRARPTP